MFDIRNHGGVFGGSRYRKGTVLEKDTEIKERYLKSDIKEVSSIGNYRSSLSRSISLPNVMKMVEHDDGSILAFFISDTTGSGLTCIPVIDGDGNYIPSSTPIFTISSVFNQLLCSPDRKNVFVIDSSSRFYSVNKANGITSLLKTFSYNILSVKFVFDKFNNCFLFFGLYSDGDYSIIKSNATGTILFEKRVAPAAYTPRLFAFDERNGNLICATGETTLNVMDTNMTSNIDTMSLASPKYGSYVFSNYNSRFICENGILYMFGAISTNSVNIAAYDLDKKIFLWEITQSFNYAYTASAYDFGIDEKSCLYVVFGRNSSSPSNSSGGFYAFSKSTGEKVVDLYHSSPTENNGSAYYLLDILQSKKREQDFITQLAGGNAYNGITGMRATIRTLPYSHIEII